jgi:predicted phosphodiesterase
MTIDELVPDDEIGPTIQVDACRIGILGDDHNAHDDGGDLPNEVFSGFADVELIIHLGHMGQRERLGRGVLDRLAAVAPVVAVRDYSTDADGRAFVTPPEGERVAGLTRVVESHGVRIGAVHNLSRPPGPPIPLPPGGVPDLDGIDVAGALAAKFGGPVDVVAFGSSHRAVVGVKQGVLFVNPGSPTYPRGPGRAPGRSPLGTVGVLDLAGGAVTFELIELACLRADAEAADAAAATGSRDC